MTERPQFVREQPQPVPDLPDYAAFMANGKYGKTKADRQAAYDKLVASRNEIIASNRGLPERNAKAFETWQNEGKALNSDTQAAYDATTRGQVMNALKQFGPYVAGAGAGFGISSAADAGEKAMIDRAAGNLRSAAGAANALNWRDPAIQNQLAGAVQTGEKYLPSKHPILNSLGTKSISYGVPALAALYEMSRYSDSANNPDRSEAQREQDRMYANALMAASGEMGFHGGVKLAIPYSADTGASEATIRGARGALTDMAKGVAPTADAVQAALKAAAKQPPAFNKGASPTEAMRTLARYLDVNAPEGTALKNFAPQVAKAAANASDKEISAIASAARPAIEDGSRAGVLEWVSKLSKPGARRLPVIAGLTAGTAALMAGRDEARSGDRTSEMYGPHEDIPPPTPKPSFGERAATAVGNAAIGAGEMLPYAIPYLRTAKTAADIASAYDPAEAARIRALPHPSQSNPVELRDRMAERRQGEQNLASAQAEDRRQVQELMQKRAMELNSQPGVSDAEFNNRARELDQRFSGVPHQPIARPANAMQTLENAADEDAKAATGYAKGGEVHPMTRGISGLMRSAEAGMRRAVQKIDHLHKAPPGPAVLRALEKAWSERDEAVHDLWAAHYLAQHLNSGRVRPQRGMTKQAILALARSHYNRETGLPHGR
jgi:hypothetical protein